MLGVEDSQEQRNDFDTIYPSDALLVQPYTMDASFHSNCALVSRLAGVESRRQSASSAESGSQVLGTLS